MSWNQEASFNAASAAEKLRYESQNKIQAPTSAQCGQEIGRGMTAARRSSLCEEAEERARRDYETAAKADRAAAFFRAHPEFDEFIQLIRQGVIGI